MGLSVCVSVRVHKYMFHRNVGLYRAGLKRNSTNLAVWSLRNHNQNRKLPHKLLRRLCMKVFGIFSKTHQLNQRRPASASDIPRVPTTVIFFFFPFPLQAFRITTAVSTSLRKGGANFWELQLDSCAVMQKVRGGGGGVSKLVWKNERMDGRHEPDTPKK